MERALRLVAQFRESVEDFLWRGVIGHERSVVELGLGLLNGAVETSPMAADLIDGAHAAIGQGRREKNGGGRGPDCMASSKEGRRWSKEKRK